MKKLTKMMSVMVLGASLLMNTAHAQTDWHVTGNSGTTSGNFLGTIDTMPLRIRTVNSERVHINGNTAGKVGYVGIGTSAPAAKLHVQGPGNWNLSSSEGDFKIGNGTYRLKMGVALAGGGAGDAYIAAQGGTSGIYIGSGNTFNSLYTLSVKQGHIGCGGVENVYRFGAHSFDNTDATMIGVFSSADATQGVGIGRNSIGCVGTSANQDLSIRSKGASSYLKFLQGNTLRANINNIGDFETDLADANDGTWNSGGRLRFGFASGEGIASKRNAGGNQYGLDFYAGGIPQPRLSITNKGTVGIGTTAPAARVDVQGDSVTYMQNVLHSQTNYNGNVYVVAIDALATPALGYGVGLHAEGGSVGLKGLTRTPNATDLTIGGSFDANGAGSGARYGVYADASGSTTDNWAVYSNGSSFATGTWQSSDARLKTNVKPLESALDKVMQLHPSTYNFKTDEYAFMNLPHEKQYGFLAQELEKVFPEMVKEIQQPLNDKDGNPTHETFKFKGVNYDQMIAVLTSAIQEEHKAAEQTRTDAHQQLNEKDNTIKNLQSTVGSLQNENEMQQKQIDELKNTMKNFENALSQCCSSYESTHAKQQDNVTADHAKLEQNNPNPFTESSTIKFYIPTSAINAMIKIYSLNGTEMNTFNNLSKGLGQVAVNANSLAPGVYVYALIVDGKTTDTKQMIVTK